MSHWSENAQSSANQSMTTQEPTDAVRDCEDRDWEPLAEVEELPDWMTEVTILSGPDLADSQAGEPESSQPSATSPQDD